MLILIKLTLLYTEAIKDAYLDVVRYCEDILYMELETAYQSGIGALFLRQSYKSTMLGLLMSMIPKHAQMVDFRRGAYSLVAAFFGNVTFMQSITLAIIVKSYVIDTAYDILINIDANRAWSFGKMELCHQENASVNKRHIQAIQTPF